MSTIIFSETPNTFNVKYSKHFVVPIEKKEIEDLADYVQRIRFDKDLSLRDVEKRSNGKITGAYINNIENRLVLGNSVTPKKLSALATGLGVSEEEVFAIARGKSTGEKVAFDEADVVARLYFKNKKLSPGRKKEFREIFAMVERDIDRRLLEQEKEEQAKKSDNGKK
jgi:transcriptional regulator with XRE-family HTH domain